MDSTGLDIGTNTIIAARADEDGDIVYKKQRDAFFEIKTVSEFNASAVRKSLEARNIDFIKKPNSFYVVGEEAIQIANERGRNVRRPMSRGIISAREKESLPMIKLLIQSTIGKARTHGEKCVYSIPADPIEGEFDAVYHKGILKMFLAELGYTSDSIYESEAVVYSELINEDLTGMAISFGAGMVNVCLMNLGEHISSFSIPKSGDWIDHSIAIALDTTDSIAQAEKEAGIDLLNPQTKLQQAASLYYQNLLEYILKVIVYRLADIPKISFSKEGVPIILAGGLTLAEGFISKFRDTLSTMSSELPLKISDVRYAEDRINAVARGCLMAAMM